MISEIATEQRHLASEMGRLERNQDALEGTVTDLRVLMARTETALEKAEKLIAAQAARLDEQAKDVAARLSSLEKETASVKAKIAIAGAGGGLATAGIFEIVRSLVGVL